MEKLKIIRIPWEEYFVASYNMKPRFITELVNLSNRMPILETIMVNLMGLTPTEAYIPINPIDTDGKGCAAVKTLIVKCVYGLDEKEITWQMATGLAKCFPCIKYLVSELRRVVKSTETGEWIDSWREFPDLMRGV